MNFGAFIELTGGKDGMLHISKMADHRVEKVEDVMNIGDEIEVKVNEIDSQGRVNLIRNDITYTKNVSSGRDNGPRRRPPAGTDAIIARTTTSTMFQGLCPQAPNKGRCPL